MRPYTNHEVGAMCVIAAAFFAALVFALIEAVG